MNVVDAAELVQHWPLSATSREISPTSERYESGKAGLRQDMNVLDATVPDSDARAPAKRQAMP